MNGQGVSRDELEKGLRVLARIIARKMVGDGLNGRAQNDANADPLSDTTCGAAKRSKFRKQLRR